jgi:hypothetical protein
MADIGSIFSGIMGRSNFRPFSLFISHGVILDFYTKPPVKTSTYTGNTLRALSKKISPQNKSL